MRRHVGETRRLKKSKKFTQSPFTSTVPCAQKSRTNLLEKVSFVFSSCFSEGTSPSQQLVLDRRRTQTLSKMKRLFGVKKTVGAPSLEETTGKVLILSSSSSHVSFFVFFFFFFFRAFIESPNNKTN